MKISSQYNNFNLFEAAKRLEADGKSEARSERAITQSSVLVDISKEAMDKYRTEIQEEAVSEDDEEIRWLNTEDYTINCVKISGKDENGNALSARELAQELLEEYKSKYQQLVNGYADGTIKIYSEDGENRLLTREEALQKLTEFFEDHARTMEEMMKQQDEAAKLLEDSIRKTPAWKKTSQRARDFLEEQDKKREDYTYQPEHFSENIIKAGAAFRELLLHGLQINKGKLS